MSVCLLICIMALVLILVQVPWTVILAFDNFYRPLNPAQRQKAFAKSVFTI